MPHKRKKRPQKRRIAIDRLTLFPTIADNAQLQREVLRGLEAVLAKEPIPFSCRRCRVWFTPQRGQWIFHDLCDSCFALFDEQKMAGRAAYLRNQSTSYYEDAGEWIIAHPLPENG
jgi:hypothetical protein